ncbi:hypothetical protein MSP7336_01256 [Mycobacterium shimoidei]|uniref:Uncharacterized protein n=1 Tax=Mycobacterium shimoidei TaxID=29313 RepID=A0A375YW04_MYCSH|nr:hypothetical protein MSP7336_01256 [Mycobacterium shimoidei]
MVASNRALEAIRRLLMAETYFRSRRPVSERKAPAQEGKETQEHQDREKS